jgi:nucleotide-binding universal stress UspA family protein
MRQPRAAKRFRWRGFKRILVPVDFTPRNQEALAVAWEMAQPSRGRVVLLHVIERIEHISPRSLAEFYRKLYRAAEEKMGALVRGLEAHGGAPTSVIAFGKRSEGIVRYASTRRVDLIVMSSHPLGPGRSRGWATISHQVAVRAPCGVLLVKEARRRT